MKISPNHVNTQKNSPYFGAKLSHKVTEEFEFLETVIEGLYGKQSERFKDLSKNMKAIKTLCPRFKISEKKGKDMFGYTAYDLAIIHGRKKAISMNFNAPDEETLYTEENVSDLAIFLQSISQYYQDKNIFSGFTKRFFSFFNNIFK